MKNWSFARIGIVFMLLVMAVALTGMGYGLWAQTLTISETVNTGSVSLEYTLAFTNDDGIPTDVSFDPDDNNASSTQIFDFNATSSSADPLEPGPFVGSPFSTTTRYDKDVGECSAQVSLPDTATLTKSNVYPSYHCTAWFDIVNNGSVPVKIKSITLDILASPGTSTKVNPLAGAIAIDLDNDDGDNILATEPDVEVSVLDVLLCQQIDPQDPATRVTIDQHVLQDAPQGAFLLYTVKIEMAQWNELGNTVDPQTNECTVVGGP